MTKKKKAKITQSLQTGKQIKAINPLAAGSEKKRWPNWLWAVLVVIVNVLIWFIPLPKLPK